MFLKILYIDETFVIHSRVDSVYFDRHTNGGSEAHITYEDKSSTCIGVPSIAYVMNDNGKTVATYTAPPDHPPPDTCQHNSQTGYLLDGPVEPV